MDLGETSGEAGEDDFFGRLDLRQVRDDLTIGMVQIFQFLGQVQSLGHISEQATQVVHLVLVVEDGWNAVVH